MNLLFTAVFPTATSGAELAARVFFGEPDLKQTPSSAAHGCSRDGYGMNPHNPVQLRTEQTGKTHECQGENAGNDQIHSGTLDDRGDAGKLRLFT